jgi:predicted ribosomally synthesized peptide with nif11-like leader
MSQAEIERFSNDVKTDAGLREEVTTKGTQIPALLKVAKAHGYEITENDFREYIRSKSAELTEEEIESVVGGMISRPTVMGRAALLIVIYL